MNSHKNVPSPFSKSTWEMAGFVGWVDFAAGPVTAHQSGGKINPTSTVYCMLLPHSSFRQ
jgi:hypothetical protein